MYRKCFLLPVVGAAMLLAGAVSPARAALQIQISTPGATTVSVVDNGVGDSDPLVGKLTFSGAIGNFSTVITTSTSNSPGANGLAILQTHDIAVRETTPTRDSLTIRMGDVGFNNPAGQGLVLGSSFAGTFLSAVAGESVSFQSYADASNTIFGTGVTSGLHTATLANGSAAPGGFSTTDRTAPFASAGPYSMMDVTVINLSQSGQVNISGTTTITSAAGEPIPEPASLGLLGLGAAMLLGKRRRHAA